MLLSHFSVALASAALVALAGLAGPAAAAGRLYVAATSADKLYIYDTGSNDLLSSVTVGKTPHGLALSDDGRWAWVAIDGGIVKVDALRRTVAKTYPLGDLQQELELTRDGRYLYTGRLADGCYEVFDTVQEKVVAGMPVGGYPHNVVRAANDDRFMYAAALSNAAVPAPPPMTKAARSSCDPARAGRVSASNRIYVFDTRTMKTVGTIPTGDAPRPMTISADGKRLYSDVDGLEGFLVIDTASRKVIERVSFPKLTQEQKTTGTRGHGLGITRDQRELWAASTLHDVVDVYDRTGPKMKFLAQIKVEGMPHWITFSPDGRFGYASLNDSDKVAVIDVATHRVVKNIQLPQGSGPKTIDAGPVASN
jgi:DNA-binding beta-propeller fold protein YncE